MQRLRFGLFVLPFALIAACGGNGNSNTSTSSSSSSSSSGSGGTGAVGGMGGTGGGPICPASGISKGPWSLKIDGTSAIVRWEGCRAGANADVVYAPEAGGADTTVTANEMPYVTSNTYNAPLNPEATPDYAGTWYMHEAKLTSLAPATCYSYHLAADASAKGRFCTQRAPGDPLRFWTIGDTNPGIGPYAAGVLANILPKKPDFVLHGADIQYYDSGLETWASWFPVMEPMLAGGGFFPAVGNHEAEKPDELQQYDMRFFGTAGFDGTDRYWRFSSAGVWFFSVDTEESIDPGSEQGAWLVNSLEDATKQPGFRFSIVYMHKPLVTCGDTGDNPDARAKLEPFFDMYQVPIIIQAHMHGYERFELGKFTYLTSAGGGGRIGDPDANVQRSYCGQRVVSGGYRHGVVFDVSAGMITGTAIDYQGTVIDTFSKAVP